MTRRRFEGRRLGRALSSSPDLAQFRVRSVIYRGTGLTVETEAGREAYYVLGRSAEEVERLQSQAAFIRPFTERPFRDAGIARGMKVLDLGSGAGDAALLAAYLVGQEGTVVGIDTNSAILEVARDRARDARHRNVSFEAGDIRELPLARDFASPSFSLARTLSYSIVNVYMVRMAGVFMISTSTVAMATHFAPRWLSALGYLLAVLLLLGSPFLRWSFALLPLWVLLLNVHIPASNLGRRTES